ncbi:hypothetical protein NDU88_005619 [Pleurodeles waltl]|uniref:Uncharacterized protein n=1 Tax=Pleurodeles waltl TaxID=8319 RepID=A0AAV7L542_PLEWA|nr:hypothetical protein NDU88_005619 [Pleurodeles waltl]
MGRNLTGTEAKLAELDAKMIRNEKALTNVQVQDLSAFHRGVANTLLHLEIFENVHPVNHVRVPGSAQSWNAPHQLRNTRLSKGNIYSHPESSKDGGQQAGGGTMVEIKEPEMLDGVQKMRAINE